MRFPIPTVFLIASISLTAQAAEPAPPAKFRALFNGKDLAGWHGTLGDNPVKLVAMPTEERDAKIKEWTASARKHWTVQNGELVNDGEGAYLTSDQDFGDFELLIDYKTVAKADSGIYLRGTPQVQIWDSTEGDPRGLGQDKGSGGLWNNRKGSPGKDPLKKMDKPLGEWNTLKMTMIGERVTVVLNGEIVVDNAPLENYFANKKSG